MQVNKSKKKGYVLVIVLLVALLMATVITATFSVLYRYYRLAKRDVEQLRADVRNEESIGFQASDAWQEVTP